MIAKEANDEIRQFKESTTEQKVRQLTHAFEGSRDTVRRRYESLLGYFSAGDRVLDLGCGCGTFLDELAKQGVSGIGVDTDPERVAECENRGLKVYRRRVQDFVNESSEDFDGIVLTHVIEHMGGEEAFKLLAHCARLLRPNGTLIVVTPNFSHGAVSSEIFWLDITHVRPYPLRLITEMVRILGLRVLEARVAPWTICDVLVVGCKSDAGGTDQETACEERLSRAPKGGLILNLAVSFGLRDGHPVLARCNERIVEIPFVHRNLPYPFRGRLIDVGSLESQLCFEAACLGFDTCALDTQPQMIKFPSVQYVQADIRACPFPRDFFDVAIACSTIEHIGLFAYGQTRHDPEGDVHAVEAIHGILKPNGRLILTVPFGTRGATDWYRVYDHDSLQQLLSRARFIVETQEYWVQKDLQWMPATWVEANSIDSVSHRVQSVACILARPE